MDNHSGLDALQWPRFNGADDDAASYLASLIRTEIGLGNWPANERIPDRTLLAEAIGAKVDVADMAIDQLARGGWITVHPDSGHLAVEPPPQRFGTFYEAVWGEAPPRDVEPAMAPVLVPAVQPPATDVGVKPPVPPLAPPRRPTVTYLIGINGLPFVKIGRTRVDAKARMANLQCGQPMELLLLCTFEGDYEPDLHVLFDAYRIRGEWFDLRELGDPVTVVTNAINEIRAD